jgi:hypothetical protein
MDRNLGMWERRVQHRGGPHKQGAESVLSMNGWIIWGSSRKSVRGEAWPPGETHTIRSAQSPAVTWTRRRQAGRNQASRCPSSHTALREVASVCSCQRRTRPNHCGPLQWTPGLQGNHSVQRPRSQWTRLSLVKTPQGGPLLRLSLPEPPQSVCASVPRVSIPRRVYASLLATRLSG